MTIARLHGAASGRRTAFTALALVGLPVALVALLAGLLAWQGEREAQAAVRARAENAAFTASAYIRSLVGTKVQALQRIADLVASRPESIVEPDTADLNDLVPALPREAPIAIYDAAGHSVLSTEPGEAPPDIADTDHFRAVRDGTTVHVGTLAILGPGNRRVFPISRRIEVGGRFAAAVVAYVPAELMAQFWTSMELGPGSTIGLLRDDGWLVARHPLPERALNLANYPLFTEHLRQAPVGTYRADVSPADGIGRLVAYRRVDGLPLVTVVGIPTSSLATALRQRLTEIALVAAPIGVALLVVSLWAVRLLRQEERGRAALAVALEENRTLLREIHHRVKNNLQTVSALIQLQPGPNEGKDDLRRRIAAMAAVHEQIYGSDRFDGLDIATYIRSLVARLREGYGSRVEVHCHLAPLRIGPDQALPLSLIVNEAVSNAFKHGYPDGRAGLIVVSLETDPERGAAVLRVVDDGVGYQPGQPPGTGTRLVRGLAQQLDGTVETTSRDGAIFTLTFPLGAGAIDMPKPQAA